MIGIDIVKVKRIKKILTKEEKLKVAFLNRILNKNEQDMIAKKKHLNSKAQSIAGYWAIKEALSKALGVGIGKNFSFLHCEIKKDKLNKPYIKLDKKIKKRFNIKSKNVNISITHDGDYAIGVVVVNK